MRRKGWCPHAGERAARRLFVATHHPTGLIVSAKAKAIYGTFLALCAAAIVVLLFWAFFIYDDGQPSPEERLRESTEQQMRTAEILATNKQEVLEGLRNPTWCVTKTSIPVPDGVQQQITVQQGEC